MRLDVVLVRCGWRVMRPFVVVVVAMVLGLVGVACSGDGGEVRVTGTTVGAGGVEALRAAIAEYERGYLYTNDEMVECMVDVFDEVYDFERLVREGVTAAELRERHTLAVPYGTFDDLQRWGRGESDCQERYDTGSGNRA